VVYQVLGKRRATLLGVMIAPDSRTAEAMSPG